MELGFTDARGLLGGGSSREQGEGALLFVVQGTQSSANPLKAFAQGLAGEPADREYRISGRRCSACGLLELYADGEPV